MDIRHVFLVLWLGVAGGTIFISQPLPAQTTQAQPMSNEEFSRIGEKLLRDMEELGILPPPQLTCSGRSTEARMLYLMEQYLDPGTRESYLSVQPRRDLPSFLCEQLLREMRKDMRYQTVYNDCILSNIGKAHTDRAVGLVMRVCRDQAESAYFGDHYFGN